MNAIGGLREPCVPAPLPLTPCRAIAVASGKGGVGKTNISVNLALALSRLGKRVLLMDADLGLANIDVLLNLRPRWTLQHVLGGERSLEDILVEGPLGVRVIPAASGVGRMAELDPRQQHVLIRAFDELSGRYDCLIVDSAAGISGSVIGFSKAAQELIVVVCDEPASITDAYALIKVLSREHGVRRFRILTNQVRDSQHGRKLYAKLAAVADDYLDVSLGYLGSVPQDEHLRQAVANRHPVMTLYPASRSALAFGDIAERIGKWPDPPAGNGRLAFFLEKNFSVMSGQGVAAHE